MGDAPLTSLGFNDTAFTVIDGNMTGVNNDITGLCCRKAAYASSYIRPFSRCQVVTAVYAAVPEDIEYEMRAVTSVCQGIASPYIRTSDKLISIINNAIS